MASPLVHGHGRICPGIQLSVGSPPPAPGTRQSVLFSPPTLQCSRVAPTAEDRFYSNSLTLADGRLMTLFGSGSKSIEVYNRGTSTWSPAIATPAQMAHHQYYPWTYVLPSGKLFIAGPHVPTQRFDWSPAVRCSLSGKDRVYRGARHQFS